MRALSVYIFLIFCTIAHATKNTLVENYSLTMIASGDIAGEYNLSGPVNGNTEAESETENSKCRVQCFARKATVGGKFVLEVWPQFICKLENQTKTLKINKIYLDLSKNDHKKNIILPDLNIHNVTLEFKELSLSKGK